MAIFKCKMCGGNLDIADSTGVITCEYCGTCQTVTKSRDEIISNLFNRANDLRLKSEFDRAEQTYEKILEKDNTEAEAHWGIVLCRYGIEYVDDPVTSKKIPTCHRTSYEAITSDADYIAAIQFADAEQKTLYEQEARAIDVIQKNILEVVKKEEPFDVFICYKETDENGKRTIDSTISNDIYYQLTQEGLKVFYAPITLEDKLGEEYEPYIFAALNSAKVMLVVGTKPEYFNAVWVKNEWSRYLKLLKGDRTKLLIPCYRDMDAYNLPEEFAHLQAQDMSKIGFINDVVRGIKKVINKEKLPTTANAEQYQPPVVNKAPVYEKTSTYETNQIRPSVTPNLNKKRLKMVPYNKIEKTLMILSAVFYFIFFHFVALHISSYEYAFDDFTTGHRIIVNPLSCVIVYVLLIIISVFFEKLSKTIIVTNLFLSITYFITFLCFVDFDDPYFFGLFLASLLPLLFVIPRVFGKSDFRYKAMAILGTICFVFGTIAIVFIVFILMGKSAYYSRHGYPLYAKNMGFALFSGVLAPMVLSFANWPRKNKNQLNIK